MEIDFRNSRFYEKIVSRNMNVTYVSPLLQIMDDCTTILERRE
ncbi:hypothetical protein CLV36_11623 [Laceyella sediminis]|uniref:Uncharacterized protein n=1 Tax=Laceyella sediminis TaxID=573074 RepID=A0ABX5EMD1_9BACL|nr:hypothetical protein CLV36_11623 [Laceyella sediminis]